MKKRWFWIFITIGVLLLLGNIAVTIWVGNNCPSKTDWLTLISGWISGISTLVVGIIAYAQNKKYTLISIKNEIKNNIKNEKKEILEICNQLTQYSKYMNFLGYKFDNTNKQKSELSYKCQLDELKEFIMINTTKFQLFDYIPNNMAIMVDKLLKKQMENYDQYDKILDCDDCKLSILIDTIHKNTLYWISSVVETRNNIVKELEESSNKLNALNTINKVYEFVENLKEKTNNAREKSNILINQMIEKRKSQKENTNE